MVDFGELRSIVLNAPSNESWIKLLSIVQRADLEEQREALIPYIEDQLQGRWPEAIQHIPLSELVKQLKRSHPLPWLRLVRATTVNEHNLTQGDAFRLLNHPDLKQLTYLNVQELTDESRDAFHKLIEHPKCELKSLILPGNALSYLGDGPQNALSTDALLGLRELKIRSNHMTPEHYKQLLASSFMQHIEHLNMESTGYRTVEELEALCQTLEGPSLKSLSMGHSDLSDDAIKVLASHPNMANLTYLSAWSNRIGDEGIEALSSSKHITKLRYINLGGNRFADKGLLAMAHSTNFQELELLWMWSINHKSNTLRDFFALADMPRLTTLNMNNNKVSTRNLLQLAKSDFAPTLKGLHLYGTALELKHLQQLFKFNNMNALEFLDLSSNNIDDEGLEWLASLSCLSKLQKIHLDMRSYTIDGTRRFAASPHIKSLVAIELNSDVFDTAQQEDLWPDKVDVFCEEEPEDVDDLDYQCFSELMPLNDYHPY